MPSSQKHPPRGQGQRQAWPGLLTEQWQGLALAFLKYKYSVKGQIHAEIGLSLSEAIGKDTWNAPAPFRMISL